MCFKSILFQLLLTILSCQYFPIELLILLICRSSLHIKGISRCVICCKYFAQFVTVFNNFIFFHKKTFLFFVKLV